ncbi:hypothetical protein [Pseudomonas sp.]|uniref:hypothetical protein n=1 Tax=Pseudomonas sp. TaxID=306 RepID=UPI003FD7CE12
MKCLLIAVVLLAGCAQQQIPQEQPQVTKTTVYRYVSAACAPAEDLSGQLRQALKSRDQWKRYAESLEQLPAAKKSHDPNP